MRDIEEDDEPMSLLGAAPLSVIAVVVTVGNIITRIRKYMEK